MLAIVFQLYKFLIVGSVATSLHICVVGLLQSFTSMPVIASSTIAFILASNFSFLANYKFTFASDNNFKISFLRFFLVAFMCYIVHIITLFIFISLTPLSTMGNVVFAAIFTALVSFMINKHWTFA